jgi:hypothetical protein
VMFSAVAAETPTNSKNKKHKNDKHILHPFLPTISALLSNFKTILIAQTFSHECLTLLPPALECTLS